MPARVLALGILGSLVHAQTAQRSGEIHDERYALPHEFRATMSLRGVDLEGLFAGAFAGRHVVFLGDSTTYSMHRELAKLLYVAADEECARLTAAGNTTPCDGDEPGAADVVRRNIAAGTNQPGREMKRRKRLGLAEDEPEPRFNATRLRASIDSMEAHAELDVGCPDGLVGRARRCDPYFGIDEGSKELKAISIRVPNSHRGGGPRGDFAISVVKGQGALPMDHALSKLKFTESKQGGQRADVVILTGGLHYLHLWPPVPFESAKDRDSSWFHAADIIANYSAEVSAAIRGVRKHVGPGGFVVWKSTNDVCEGSYFSVWSSLANLFQRGFPPAPSKDTSHDINGAFLNGTAVLSQYDPGGPFSYQWNPRKTGKRKSGSVRRFEPVIATLRHCDAYVRAATRNSTWISVRSRERLPLNCTNSLLAHSGASMLSSIRVPIEEEEGLATFRVLDAYAITRGQCNLTARGDGRHYLPLDLGMLKVIAEAAVAGGLTRPADTSRDFAALVRSRNASKKRAHLKQQLLVTAGTMGPKSVDLESLASAPLDTVGGNGGLAQAPNGGSDADHSLESLGVRPGYVVVRSNVLYPPLDKRSAVQLPK